MRPAWLHRRALDWLAIAAVALVVRFLAVVTTGAFQHPQLFEYEEMARSLLAGQGLTYRHLDVDYHSFAAPLYPWICAAVYLVTGGAIPALFVLQMTVNAAHCALTAAFTEQLSHVRAAGLAAGLLMAVHPGLVIYSSTKGDPLPFTALFFMLILWQFWRLRDQPTRHRAIETGVVVGLAMLCRPTAAIFLPLGGVWLLATGARDRWSLLVGRVAIAAVCAGAILTPWIVRNTLVNGEFVPFLTTDAEDFWRGNNPHATGHSYVAAGRIVRDTLTPAEQQDLRSQPNEMAQARWFRAHAWTFIKAEPGAFLRLTVVKFFHFWWFAPQTGALYPHMWRVAYQVYYVALLLLAVVGLHAVATNGQTAMRQQVGLIGLFLAALSGLQSLYYVEGRHRWSVEPFLIMLSGIGASVLLARVWPAAHDRLELMRSIPSNPGAVR